MQTVQKLKKELELNSELINLLDVLKSVAASEYHILEKKKDDFTKFLDTFKDFFQMMDFSSLTHAFASGKGNLGIILITSDEGFMGGLNSRVINMGLDYPGASDARFIVIGERGASYLKGCGFEFTAFAGIREDKMYESAIALKEHIVKEALAGKFGRLILVYPRSISFTAQRVDVLKILPVSELFEKREIFSGEVILESAFNNIIEYLLEAWIIEKLLMVFQDSKLSEFSCRTVRLEESHQVLTEIGTALQLKYFRQRRSVVDKQMRETFSTQLIRKTNQLKNNG
ncbi:MAG: FoF1 ATP synthase subunit gamma [Candidatus Omnitrophota bacterium]